MATSGVLMDKERIVRAIYKYNGILIRAAKELDCDRRALQKWAHRDPEIAEAIKEARHIGEIEREDQDEEIKDLAYDSIVYHLKKKNLTATLASLEAKTKWKKPLDLNVNGNLKVETVSYKDA